MRPTWQIFLILAFPFLGACSPSATSLKPALPQTFTVPSEKWSVDRVSLSCPSGDCPSAVGMVLFFKVVTVSEGHLLRISRCTATYLENHQVLTNAHCLLPGWEKGYFFYRTDQKTAYRAVDDNLALVKDAHFGRDLSLWSLKGQNLEIHGLPVARSVPTEMEKMTAFVTNDLPAKDMAQSFAIEKRMCGTRDRVPVIDAGVDDRTTSLALFDCEIRHGNSGSPVFTANDFSQVQGMVNSIWNFDPKVEPLGKAYDWLFVHHAPEYLNHFFALSERLHCLPISDQPNPLQPCSHLVSLNTRLKTIITRLIDQVYTSNPEPKSGVVWGVRPQLTKLSLDGETKIGLEMVPVPICAKPGYSFTNRMSPEFFLVGLDKNNNMDAILTGPPLAQAAVGEETIPLKACGPFDYLRDREAAKGRRVLAEPDPIETNDVLNLMNDPASADQKHPADRRLVD